MNVSSPTMFGRTFAKPPQMAMRPSATRCRSSGSKSGRKSKSGLSSVMKVSKYQRNPASSRMISSTRSKLCT